MLPASWTFYSINFTSWGTRWVSIEAKLFKEFNILHFNYSCSTHSELKCQISFGKCSWRHSAPIWHFCIPLAFLDVKNSKKIIKGRRRSERPNQRPGTKGFKFWPFFMSLWLFSVDYAQFALFSSLKVVKVKRAALIAGAASLRKQLFLVLKVLL